MNQSLKKGFTLIELLAVIAIIGILAALALAGVANATKRARDARRQNDANTIKTALELYNNDNGAYPESLTTLVDSYVKSLPRDPKTQMAYSNIYKADNDGADFVINIALENKNAKQTFPSTEVNCDNFGVTPKGNGVIKSGSKACFRLTND